MLSRIVACFLVSLLPVAHAIAETAVCPELSSASVVGTCPSEEELQFTFTGYCSDNARIYNWHEETVCTDYSLYRRLKNIVLWETRGGDYQGYLSCDLPQDKVKTAKVATIAVVQQGKMTRVVCSYGEGISFSYRTKARCKIEGSGNCAAEPATCRAICE